MSTSTSTDTLPQSLRTATFLAGHAAATTGILGYFGWVEFHSTMGQFGVKSGLVHMTAFDYVTFGVGALDPVVVVLAVVGFALSYVHWRSYDARVSFSLAISRVYVGTGIILTFASIVGLLDWLVYSTRYAIPPLLLASGITLTKWGVDLSAQQRNDAPPSSSTLRVHDVFLALLVIGCAVWSAGVYAKHQGSKSALQYLDNRQYVTLTSHQRLDLPNEQRSTNDDFPYKYTGLRLLLYNHNRYFLVPDNGKISSTYLVEENEGINVILFPTTDD